MRVWLVLGFVVACSAKRDVPTEHTQSNGYNDPGLRLAICGTVGGWAPPSPDTDGTLMLDDAAWRVASDTRLRGMDILRDGADVCLAATLDTERRIVDGDVSPAPAEDPWARLPP